MNKNDNNSKVIKIRDMWRLPMGKLPKELATLEGAIKVRKPSIG